MCRQRVGLRPGCAGRELASAADFSRDALRQFHGATEFASAHKPCSEDRASSSSAASSLSFECLILPREPALTIHCVEHPAVRETGASLTFRRSIGPRPKTITGGRLARRSSPEGAASRSCRTARSILGQSIPLDPHLLSAFSLMEHRKRVLRRDADDLVGESGGLRADSDARGHADGDAQPRENERI